MRKLEDIVVEEISLVAVPATRKQFYIKKGEEEMDEFNILYKSLFGRDLTEVELAKAKELPEDALKAVKAAAKTLDKYKEDFGADLKGALETLVKYSSYGYPAKKSDEDVSKEMIAELTDVEKAGKRLSKATRDQLEKMVEILKSLLKEDDLSLDKTGLEKLTKEHPELAAELLRLRKLDADVRKSAADAAEKKREEDLIAKALKKVEEEFALERLHKSSLDVDDPNRDKDEPKSPLGSTEYQEKLKKSGRSVLWPSLVGAGKGGDNAN